MLDLTNLRELKDGLTKITFQEMANVVRAVHNELMKRNPIVNFYTAALQQAIVDLEVIHNAEISNPTCDDAGR